MFRRLVLACCCLLVAAANAAEPVLHDPTQPYNALAPETSAPVGTPAPRFVLTGVLISPLRRIAIVNGKAYQEGQRVAGAELTRIESHSVQLSDGKHDFVVQLGKARASARSAEGDSGQ